WHFALARHRALGIVGIRRDAEPALGFVGLARAEQVTRDLGRLAETDGQQSGRERIEAAGVPRLVRPEQTLRDLQRAVGRDAPRLVQQQDAVDLAPRVWPRRV